MEKKFDIVIVGGGLVGASLACALGNSTLKVGVVESIPPGDPGQPSYDDRTIALAYSSRRIFETIGVWQPIAERSVNPIERIHISNRGHFGITRLHAKDMGIEALGYVVETRALGAALYESMQKYDNIEVLCPYEVKDFQLQETEAVLHISGEQGDVQCISRLVVLADGGRSPLRDQFHMKIDKKVYDQIAIVANVTPGINHNNTAYERFTADGPLALLPVTRERCAVVWATQPDKAEDILAWSDEEYLAQLQQRFGHRLGKFTQAGKRQSYPLVLTKVADPVRERLVLIGNAAHTVHPVAGQGFNLGLRDVASLAQMLVDTKKQNRDIGSLAMLQEYADWRRQDNRRTSLFTDGLISIFSNEFLPLVVGRNLGLLAVDLLPPLKRAFIRRTSGLSGKLPRLARGLPL
jgi:2-octaprenyl-6-methoxyphenol hydroxylase